MNQARIFWELVRRAIQRQMTYRAATLAGLVTNFFFGLLRAAVLVALYRGSRQVAGMSVQDAITYTGLTQAIIAYLSFFGWYELAQSIYSGQVGADLLKPINLFTFWMGQDLGRALVQLVLRGLPLLAFYALAFGIATPNTAGQWLALAVAGSLGSRPNPGRAGVATCGSAPPGHFGRLR
jgi:ABC-2 type transport system permease protein